MHRADERTLQLLLASLTSRSTWLERMHSAPTRATPLARLSPWGSSPAADAVPPPTQRDASGRNPDVPESAQHLHPLLLSGDTGTSLHLGRGIGRPRDLLQSVASWWAHPRRIPHFGLASMYEDACVVLQCFLDCSIDPTNPVRF